MTRHPNQQRNYGRPLTATLSPFERPIPVRLTGYELRSATGAVLQASDSLGVLMKYVEEKRSVCIIRCKDQVCVWPPEAVSSQGGDST